MEIAGVLSRFGSSRKNKLKAQDEISFVDKTTEKGEKNIFVSFLWLLWLYSEM